MMGCYNIWSNQTKQTGLGKSNLGKSKLRYISYLTEAASYIYKAACLPSYKPSKLDKHDMLGSAREIKTNS